MQVETSQRTPGGGAFRRLTALYLCLVALLAVARFGSTGDHHLYQLCLLLVVPAAIACVSNGLPNNLLAAAGVPLLALAAFRPTLEARGYVLASVAWLTLFVTLWLARERRISKTLFAGLITIGALNALYGLLQAVGGVDQIGSYERQLGDLATGTYINRNHFAGLLNMTLGLGLGALYAGFAARRHRQRASETWAWTWLVILACALLGLAVFLSLSRAGSLILIAVLFLAFVLLQVQRGDRRRGPSARVAAVVLVATVALGLAYGVDALIDRFSQVDSQRPQIFLDTVGLIADNPVVGVGPGLFRWRFRPYQTVALGSEYSHAHNDYLQSAAEWGIPLALLLWGLVFWRGYRAARLFLTSHDPWRQGIGLGVSSVVATIAIHSLVDFNLQIPANLMVFAMVLGIGWAAEGSRSTRVDVGAGLAPAREDGTGLGPAREGARPSPATFFATLALRVLLLGLLLAVAWCVSQRTLALGTALADPSPKGLESALARDPHNADFHFMLSQYYRDLNGLRDFETARHHALRAAELSPHSWRSRWELAQIHELAGDDEAAVAALREAIARNPRDSAYHWRLANLYLRLGRSADVFEPLKTALAGDASLRRPGFSLLVKSGATLGEIDSAWPREGDSRLELMRSLAREPDRFDAPELAGFLAREWETALAADPPPPVDRAGFYPAYLLRNNRPAEARAAWLTLARANGLADESYSTGGNAVWNGRFESPLTGSPLDWRLSRSEAFEITAAPGEGLYDSTALRIDFHGTENLSFAGVRQTLAVQPATRYELVFQLKTEGLTTDKGLYLELWDPVNRRGLLRTDPVLGTTPWRLSIHPFETPAEAGQLELRVRRDRSLQIDNEVAGTSWLDNVAVRALM